MYISVAVLDVKNKANVSVTSSGLINHNRCTSRSVATEYIYIYIYTGLHISTPLLPHDFPEINADPASVYSCCKADRTAVHEACSLDS